MHTDVWSGSLEEPDEKWLCRVGGVAAIVLALGYLAILPLYAQVGAPPSGEGAAWLEYLAGKTTIWWAILGLSVLTDLLFIPVGLALYVALKVIDRGLMLLATALTFLFVALDLAVTWREYATLLTLSAWHTAATNDLQRASYVAAAHTAAAMLNSPVEVVYAIVVLSLGIFMTSLVMLKGTPWKATAWLGLVTGVLGILSPTRLSAVIISNALGATFWLLLVGYRLHRLGRR